MRSMHIYVINDPFPNSKKPKSRPSQLGVLELLVQAAAGEEDCIHVLILVAAFTAISLSTQD